MEDSFIQLRACIGGLGLHGARYGEKGVGGEKCEHLCDG